MRNAIDESEAHERRTLLAGALYGALAFVGLVPVLGWASALGVLLGCALSLSNFWILARTVRALLTNRAMVGWGVATLLKFVVVAGLLFALFKMRWVSPLPFVIGLGAVPVGIALAQLFAPSRLVSTVSKYDA